MDTSLPHDLLNAVLPTTPQQCLDRAEALLQQAAGMRKEAVALQSQVAGLNERADALTKSALAFSTVAARDRQTIRYTLEGGLDVFKEAISTYEAVPHNAARLQAFTGLVEDGTATLQDLKEMFQDIQNFCHEARLHRSPAPEPESPSATSTAVENVRDGSKKTTQKRSFTAMEGNHTQANKSGTSATNKRRKYRARHDSSDNNLSDTFLGNSTAREDNNSDHQLHHSGEACGDHDLFPVVIIEKASDGNARRYVEQDSAGAIAEGMPLNAATETSKKPRKSMAASPASKEIAAASNEMTAASTLISAASRDMAAASMRMMAGDKETPAESEKTTGAPRRGPKRNKKSSVSGKEAQENVPSDQRRKPRRGKKQSEQTSEQTGKPEQVKKKSGRAKKHRACKSEKAIKQEEAE